jgi:hypothetical protein
MTDPIRLDANAIQQQITSLLLEYPDLADDEVLRADMIEGATEFKDFLARIETVRREADQNARALNGTIHDLKVRKYRMERREEAMRALAMKLLYAADLKKVELTEATYSMRNVPPSVIITDESALPDAACKFKREPDKTAIKSMLEVGAVPGATMSNGGRTLSIRVK